MLNDNAKKWVAALRSGDFEQCDGALQVGGGYCCLGVAVKIFPGPSDMDRGDLPEEVKDWLGLTGELGQYERGDLATLNDSGSTFAEIADIIESEPEGLFTRGGAR